MRIEPSDITILKSVILDLLRAWQVITDTQMLHLNTYGESELKVKWPGDFGILEIYQGLTEEGRELYINYTFEKQTNGWLIDFFEYSYKQPILN